MLMMQLSGGAQSPEMTVGFLALVLLACCGIWGLVRWVLSSPVHPDPWGEAVSADLDREDAVALCHRCLSPQEHPANFCPRCGAPVGQYTNMLPFPYLFSVGHTLRLGTAGDYRRSLLTVLGFFVLAAADMLLLAPVYWFVFLRRLLGAPGPQAPPDRIVPGAQVET